MEKLLHERLREMADGCDCEEPRKSLGYEVEDAPGKRECAWCSKGALESMADEIERYYIPRPRFEDGEPVKEGDEACQCYDHKTDVVIGIGMLDGVPKVLLKDHGWFNEAEIERPTPKVLDADGAEIKVGDTVFNVNSGNGGIVTGFDPCELVEVEAHDGGHWKNIGNNLTHEKPVFGADNVRICRGDTVFVIPGGHKVKIIRVTALIERGA